MTIATGALSKLNRLSIERGHDAYLDVDWDHPANAIDPTDPRWEAFAFDPTVPRAWYDAQTPEARARFGLYRAAEAARVGWEFENILQRGLLRRAFDMRNPDPEFRYAHHEVVEESQHSLMFHEFVKRSGLEVHGMPAAIKALANLVIIPLARWFPEMFFVMVLGGEEPIDHMQRRALKENPHPLFHRIMHIHVNEEARHVSYANMLLDDRLPQLGPARRAIIAVLAPIVLGIMARMMLYPSRHAFSEFDIPARDRRATLRSPETRELRALLVGKTRTRLTKHGLAQPWSRWLWQAMGVGHSENAEAPA